ncbi:MAG: hypothetical protein R2706_16380 [Acidimicrobiales bacterium]
MVPFTPTPRPFCRPFLRSTVRRDRIPLTGEIPSPADPPPGCVFHTRCQYSMPGKCDVLEPPTINVAPRHDITCHLPLDRLPTPVTVSIKASK